MGHSATVWGNAVSPSFVTLGSRPGKLGLRRARVIKANKGHESCSQQHLKLAGGGGASQDDKRGIIPSQGSMRAASPWSPRAACWAAQDCITLQRIWLCAT